MKTILSTTLSATLLALTLAAPALAQSEPAHKTAKPTQQDWTQVARCRVILLVDFVERQGKNFSGMTGSTFWFRVREVLRLEAEPGVEKDGLWKHNLRQLRGRSQQLERYEWLEWSLLYPQRDRASARADKAVREHLDTKQPFVLAVSTTARFSVTGVLRKGKWGRFNAAPTSVQLVPVRTQDLSRLREAMQSPKRAPEHVPVKIAPPRRPNPGNQRGG